MEGKALAERVGRSAAAALLAPRARRGGSVSTALERIELPYYHVMLEVKRRNGTTARPSFLVDGLSGEVARLELETQKWRPADPASVSPRLRADAAVDRARRLLSRSRLLLRAGRDLEPGRTLEVELVHYPYWVLTYERRAGRFDLRVLDAVSGRRAGAGVKRSVLEVFIDEARRPAVGAER